MSENIKINISMTLLSKSEDTASETTIGTFATTHSGIYEYIYRRDFSGGIESKVEIRVSSADIDETKTRLKGAADLLKNLPRLGQCVTGVKVDGDF
jgi:hypothetical protein